MKKGGFHIETPVHDPALYLHKDGTYYIYGSHMAAATSKDLRHWEEFANFTTPENPLFKDLFTCKPGPFDYVGKFNGQDYAVWAPDVSYNPYLKKYVMYFCTTASFMKSCLCMAVADDPKGPYTFKQTLLYSGFDEKTKGQTNLKEILGDDSDISRYLNPDDGVYMFYRWPNCIDPNVFHDEEGRFWMVYGSWSGGIYLLELDERTGLPIHPKQDEKNQVDKYFGYRLMGGLHKSIEGPYIFYDKVTNYYYLTISFGWLERNGGYQIRLFRSQKPQGPYVDMDGNTCFDVEEHADYGLKLIGNYNLPSLDMAYKSPGHNSMFEDIDNKIYLVYHQRFDMQWEIHEPRVHEMFRTKDGWLTVSPFATTFESLKDKKYSNAEISGIYYLVNHGRDISEEIHDYQKIHLDEEGKIWSLTKEDKKDRMIGSYLPEEDGEISFTINEITCNGVVIEMEDEVGNDTLSISGVGANYSIWAVKYL